MQLKSSFATFSIMTAMLMVTGCASTGASVATGSALGAAAGAGIGTVVDPGVKGRGRIQNVVIGTLGGAALGAGAGYLANQDREKEREDQLVQGENVGKAKTSEALRHSTEEPRLSSPKVQVQFIDDQVRGTTFIPAHFEYRIVEPARWSN